MQRSQIPASDGIESAAFTEMPNTKTSDQQRRSTRVVQPVLLNVSGQNRVGNPISELTSALAVSFHGCLYSSRYDHRLASWVTLEVVNQQNQGELHSVRAQVKYIGLPRSARELYRVGVELARPANIWGIKSPPADWRERSVNAVVGTGATAAMADSRPSASIQKTQAIASTGAAVSSASPDTVELTLYGQNGTGEPIRVLVSTDQILSAVEPKLQQAAEKAVALAVAHRLDIAVNAAVKTIEDMTEISLNDIEGRSSSRVGILGRLKATLAYFGERLSKR